MEWDTELIADVLYEQKRREGSYTSLCNVQMLYCVTIVIHGLKMNWTEMELKL